MDLLSKIEARTNQAIADKVFPGCVIGFVNAKNQRTVLNFGHLTYDKDASSVKCDTLYDIASVTKSIPTSSLLTLAIDDKKLRLDDKVIEFIPEIQNSY